MSILQLVASKTIASFLNGRLLPATSTAVASCPCADRNTYPSIPMDLVQMQTRCFADKRRRVKEKRHHKEKKRYTNNKVRKLGMRNLHPAAKMKRVISACDYWFSDENLQKDAFLRQELMDYRGYVRISTLATFPKLKHWTDAKLILDALQNEACYKRYRVIYNRELVEKVSINRRRRYRRQALEEREEAEEVSREQSDEEREERIRELEEWAEQFRSKILRQQHERRGGSIERGKEQDEGRRKEKSVREISKREEKWSTISNRGNAARDDIVNAKMKSVDAMGHKNGEHRARKDDLDALGLVDDGTTREDEILPSIIKNDGSDLLMHALVRHKRVTLQYLSGLPDRGEENDELAEGEDYRIDCHIEKENQACEKKKQVEPAITNQMPKARNLKRYYSCRQVYVIENSTQLLSFCQKLNESIESFAGETKAIGFDVEYCTLEMDIQNTLPAMLQLASPQPNGPVGLIWLDKFPNHGKDMVGRDECKDLFAILDNTNILKVGPSVSADAKHLANWWGIMGGEFVSYYFSGMVDLETEPEDELHNKNLQEMCAGVLKRYLPKLKEDGKKKNKELQKRGIRVKTSHWRRGDLTEKMKKYAADDASCAIDVWLKVQEGSNLGSCNDSLDAANAQIKLY